MEKLIFYFSNHVSCWNTLLSYFLMFPNFRPTDEEHRGADNHSADHLQRAGGVEEEDGLEDEGGDDVGRVVHQAHHVRLLHLEGEDAEHLDKRLG